ncbi:hypothetical protein D1007_25331 [Hordeum vulgare]|nr:hypothetical protein D1007_25331 [Hordeum vulgare]
METNRGVAVPPGELKAAVAGVSRPGAGGNMHVIRDIGNVVHNRSSYRQGPIDHSPGGVAVPPGELKAAVAGVSRPGAGGNMHVIRDIGNVVHDRTA